MSAGEDDAVDEPAIKVESPVVPSEREVSTTVGTGSYVAISCTAMALLITLAILGILFLMRWIQ